MKFLRFETEAAARSAFAQWIIEGSWPAYINAVAVDVVGIIHKPIGEPDELGKQDFETLPGFHINLSGAVADLAAFDIDPPDSPARVFAGWGANTGSETPASCTRRQGRLALLALGLLDEAEAAIAGIEDPAERRAGQIEYEAETWERSNLFVQQLWASLGGAPEGLDDAFRLAVTL